MAQQKSLEELRREAEELDKQKRGELAMRKEEQERQMLQKRINQEKFKRTALGKVVGGVTTVGEAITRPAKKDTSGKPIAGTGGIGARVMGAFSKVGQPKSPSAQMPRRAMSVPQPQPVQPFDMNALERQFSVFGNSAPMPQQSAIRVSRGVRIKQKVRSKGKKRRGKSVRARSVPMAQPQPVQQGFNLNDVLSRLPQ
jgi:hypothetical protein